MPGIAHQYRIIAERAGIRRRVDRGRLRVTGADRASFLQALLTNDLAALTAGQGTYAAYLTPQGRMIADLRVFIRPAEILADVPATGAQSLAETFDKLIFAEDVSVADVSAATSQLSVIGGGAADLVARIFGLDPGLLQQLPLWSQIEVEDHLLVRTDDAKLESFDMFAATHAEPAILQRFLDAGAVELSEDLWTAIRVDAGRPAFGVDMDTDTIPLEAGLLDRAISTTKGCYVGQEVVIRVLHRGAGRVARRLVRLAIPGASGSSIAPGSILRAGDKDVGRITTIANSLDGTGAIALGYVRRELAEPGNEVQVDGVVSGNAVVAALAG